MIQDFLSLFRMHTPFAFQKRFFSILTHDFSKTHPPKLLHNKHICIPKDNYQSILLPLHLSIYFVWCSCTKTLFSLSIEKCAYTYIFIWKLALYIHFYFHALFFFITPTKLQTIIFYSYKVLLCSFIDKYWNGSIKRYGLGEYSQWYRQHTWSRTSFLGCGAPTGQRKKGQRQQKGQRRGQKKRQEGGCWLIRNIGIRILFILLLHYNEQKSGQYTNCYIWLGYIFISEVWQSLKIETRLLQPNILAIHKLNLRMMVILSGGKQCISQNNNIFEVRLKLWVYLFTLDIFSFIKIPSYSFYQASLFIHDQYNYVLPWLFHL